MTKLAFLDANILIVDDEIANVRLLERFLHQAGYSNVFSTTNPCDVFSLFVECNKEPWPVSEAVAEITRQSGLQFDPEAVEAFQALPHEALV